MGKKDQKNIAIEVGSHARLTAETLHGWPIQYAVSRLIDWYASLPADGRIAIIADLGPAAKASVLRMAVEQLESGLGITESEAQSVEHERESVRHTESERAREQKDADRGRAR